MELKTTQGLRFAPIIRVSTEKQEKQGESLLTQEKQVKSYVKMLQGEIPEYCWQYKGQEHATPGFERTKIDQLLTDSTKNIFDAVIVCDASRWSRDNLKSKEGLNILRNNGIRFFVGTTEFDLFNPSQNLFLGMSAEIGEFQANEQARKSIINRIERAREGRPTAGKLPFGRKWTEGIGWEVIPEKKLIIEQAAKRYLDGEQIPKIAKSYGMNHWNLWKILKYRSGTEWPCRYVNEKLNIDETVIIKIPELLPQTTIDEINERMKNSITFVRGNRKYDHLLSGFVFCKRCGYAMTATTNHSKIRYYRHSVHNKKCSFHSYVPADELENSVLIQLVKTLGDTEAIEKAIERANPNKKEIEDLESEKEILEKDKKTLEDDMDRLVSKVSKGLLTDDNIRKERKRIEDEQRAKQTRINTIDNQLDHLPQPKKIKAMSRWAGKVISVATKHNPALIFKKDIKWKRNLIEKAFSGDDKKGSHLGVYIDTTKDKKVFSFEISGLLLNTVQTFPFSDDELMDTFNLDTFYMTSEEVEKELKQIRSNLQGKCNAYYSQCLHKRR